MPSITSFGPGNVTGITLEANAFWRVMLGGLSAEEMGLVVIYPPGGPTNRIALARVSVTIATTAEEVESVARQALTAGTLEGDIARATEGMTLFKMHSRTKEAAYNQSVENVHGLVRSYWDLRGWLQDPTTDKLLTIGAYELRLKT